MKSFYQRILIAILLIMAIASGFYIFDRRQRQKEQELNEILHQLQLKYSPAQRDTIRDSACVITQQVLQMPKGEYRLYAADRQLLQDLGLRVNQVMAEQRTSVITADSVKASLQGRVYTYKDYWLDLRLDTVDSMLTYRARDSLQTIVARQYKHKFLWWRWGTKGYEVKLINHNPHSTLLYNSYIQVTQ